jgi:RNA polymerase sigma-70 factor (ECF subfamily)
MPEHETVDDVQLMVLVAQGDKVALCKLIDRWQTPLGGFVYRYVHDREATCELVQETFVRLYQARSRFRSDMRFSSWLFKIASNLCKNHYRWRKRHPEDLAWDESCESSVASGPDIVRGEDDPAAAACRREDIAQLEKAVSAMPHALKTTLLLHYYQGQSYREIAAALGCSERGVETRLYRARGWLAKRLGCKDAKAGEAGSKMLAFTGLQ